MAVYNPHSRPEDKWAHWEDEDYIRSYYGGKRVIKAHLKLQAMLKDAGLFGIPNSSGGGGRYNQGVWIVRREHEYELSRFWYESGELFGEDADAEFETRELWATGEDSESALMALVEVVRDYIANGPKNAEIRDQEARIDAQRRVVERESDRLDRMEAKLKELRDG